MTKEEFITKANQLRKDSCNGWYNLNETVDTIGQVRVKAHGTWVQVLDCNGIKSSGPMDCSVKEFKAFLEMDI